MSRNRYFMDGWSDAPYNYRLSSLWKILMQEFKLTIEPAGTRSLSISTLVELDRVRLKSEVTDKGRTLLAGLEGTVVLCHGTEACEVEFDAIKDDFFQISVKDLEKAA